MEYKLSYSLPQWCIELMLGELYKHSHAVYSKYFTLVANQIVLFDALGPS